MDYDLEIKYSYLDKEYSSFQDIYEKHIRTITLPSDKTTEINVSTTEEVYQQD